MKNTNRLVLNARKAKRFFIIYSVIIVVITILLTVLITSKVCRHNYDYTMKDYGRTKYFTTYDVENGDTLWSIAAEMVVENPEYPSVRKYIAEVKSINNLYSDKITSGNTLVIPYFDEKQ